jgi:hypothetical protein
MQRMLHGELGKGRPWNMTELRARRMVEEAIDAGRAGSLASRCTSLACLCWSPCHFFPQFIRRGERPSPA